MLDEMDSVRKDSENLDDFLEISPERDIQDKEFVQKFN